VRSLFYAFALTLFTWTSAAAQSPIAVTGFNQDVIADSFPSQNSTSSSLDSQNYVILGSSLPATGLITASGAGSFQLAAQTASNALVLDQNATQTLTLSTPRAYDSLTLLGLATEGSQPATVVVTFSDATTQTATVTVRDWALGPVVAEFSRVSRLDDQTETGFGFQSATITLDAANRSKLVSSVSITNSTAKPAAKVSIFAVSGSTPPVAPVPTLSEWALILFGLVLAGGAALYIQRQRLAA
jgi:hypothetical protein